MSEAVSDRLILGEEGFISIVTAVNVRNREVIAGPEISARGFAEDDSVFESIQREIYEALEESMRDGVQDTHPGSAVGGQTKLLI